MKRSAVALAAVWATAEVCEAQNGNSGTSGGPVSGSDEQTAAIDLVGKQGQHQVDLFTGSFGYSIPIACAPARNGSQPKLTLSYSSAGDLGWCGMGWTLDVGSIDRNARDGFPIAYSTASPPAPLTQYDDTKGFMLNLFGKGYKLFSVATNGLVVEYRAEVDTDFLRCFLDTGNDLWTVYDKSGTAYYFGETTNTRISNPKPGWSGYGGTFHWALDQVITASGDWTTVAYTNSTSPFTGLPERQLYPFQIAYNGHTNWNGYSANFAGPDTITFQTQIRTNDWRFSFRSGFRTDQTRRLTSILSQIGSQDVWSYSLNYGISPATGRSLLTNVVIYGYSSNSATPFLTNSFAYQANPNGVSFGPAILWTNMLIATPGESGEYNPEVSQVDQETGQNVPYEYTVADLVDIDGDGLPDRVSWNSSTSPNSYQVQKNMGMQANGNGLFGSPYSFGPTSTGSGTLATNSNQFPDGSGYAELNSPEGRLIDVNGDGLPDRVEDYWWALNSVYSGQNPPYVPFTNYEVQLNLGNGFSTVSNWPVNMGPLQNTNDNSLYYYCVEDGSVNVGLFDINGDGRPDRVMSGWWQQAPMTNFMVQLNTGTNFGPVVEFGPYRSQNYNAANTTDVYGWAGIQTPDATMLDINGDGLPDRVMWPLNTSEPTLEAPHPTSFFAVEFNDGYSFESTNSSTSAPGAFDQWPGVVAQTNNGAAYYGGINYWSDSINDEPYGGMFDVNGDGLPDRVFVDVGTINQPNSSWKVYLNNGHGFSTNYIEITNIDNEGLYNLGAGNSPWWSPQCFVGSEGNLTTMIDINGDGLLDRVLSVYYNPSVYPYIPTNNYLIVQLNQGPYPDLMTNVNNGIGGTVAVAYNPSTAYDNRVDPTDPNSGSHMPFPRYVTATVTESDAINPPQTSTYSYGGGYFDGPRREFHGFAVVTNIDPTLRMTVTYFHTGGGRNYSALGEYQDTNSTTGSGNFAKSGTPYRIETYGNDGKLYRVRINQVNQNSLGNARYFPFTDLAIDCDYPGNGTPNMTATQLAYDQTTGNLTNKIEYGEITNFNPTSVNSFSFTDMDSTDNRYNNTAYAIISGNSYIVDHPASQILADGNNNTIRELDYLYNPQSGTVAEKLTRISPGYYATNSYASYTVYGMVGLTTDPVGVQTETTYESTYNTYPSATRLRAIPNSDSSSDFITSTAYDSRSGRLAISTNPAGLTTSNSFDSFCRLTETDRIPIGGGSAIWTKKYYYPSTLNPIFSGLATNYVDEVKNDGVGGFTNRTYIDGFGRIIQTRVQAENGNYRVVSTAYDGRGDIVLKTWPVFGNGATFTKPSSGQTAAWTGYDAPARIATNRPVNATFNSNGSLTSEAVLGGDSGSPLGAKTWTYVNGTDPWWIIATDEDGQTRRYHLDAFGRTNQILEVDGSSTYTNLLKYDLAGNLTNIVNAKGENIYWAYNDAGSEVAIADPYLGQWTYQLDYSGRLRVQTDARGNVVSNSFVSPTTGYQDALHRLQVQTVYGFNYSNQIVVPAYTNIYLYDASTNVNYTVYPGLLYEVIDKQGNEQNGYDTLARTVATTRFLNINSSNYTTTNGYDQADNVIAIGYPNGPTINYSYFHGKSISQVSLNNGGYSYYAVPAAAYDAFEHVTNFSYGNSLSTTRTYFPVSERLEYISAGSVFTRSFQYTAGSDITSISGTGIGGTMNIAYYNLHRVKSYTALSGSYGYDPTGNITNNIEGGGSAYSYANPRLEAVRTAFGYTNLYDLCGNMIVRHGGGTNSQAMVYDLENRLSTISQAGAFSCEFGYAYDGARLWKRVDQNPTNIQVWIGDIYEQKAGKTLFHVFAGDDQVCTFEAGSFLDSGTNAAAVGYYYHEDNLNTSSALSDYAHNQIEVDLYFPFGRVQTNNPQANFQVSRRFTGQIFDAESGLYYYGTPSGPYGRYFDPELGRFIQADTTIADISNPQTYNRYSYCVNNPLTYTDPTGHSFWSWIENNWNPSLIWDPEVGEGIEDVLGGVTGTTTENPYSYSSQMEQNGMPLWTPLKDENGNDLGNPALAPVNAGASSLFQAGMTMGPMGEEKAGAEMVEGGTKTLEGALNGLKESPVKTPWGWSNGKKWRDAVKSVAQAGLKDDKTLQDVLGHVPTKDEALGLIQEAGGTPLREAEGGHEFPNPHNFPHINYLTPSGAKATIRIQGL
ncbi:MAG TPA: toxin TcdB middle/N-terminal domain-containing protein [Verrucomicrobiae bacterium]